MSASQRERPGEVVWPDSGYLASVAREAARAVAPRIREAFSEQVDVEYKGSKYHPVTEVDRASEARIRKILIEATPGAAIIGEEYGAEGAGRLRWHVDPIDGTHNFVSGIPYVSVSIGAELDGRMLAGVVLDPIHDECFWATEKEAWINTERLPTAQGSIGSPGVLTSFPFQGLQLEGDRLQEMLRVCASLGVVGNPGSFALQLAHVAAGRASAALELGASPWDIAGGMALISAMGCTHVPLAPAPDGYGDWASPFYLVVRDPEVAEAAVPRLRALLVDQGGF